MATLPGLYPLSTTKGLPIPLEVAKCIDSCALAVGTSAINLVEVGSLVQIYSPILVRIAFTAQTTLDLSSLIVVNSFYLPPGASAVLVVDGSNVFTAAGIPGQTGTVYINQIELWQATAREQEFVNG